ARSAGEEVPLLALWAGNGKGSHLFAPQHPRRRRQHQYRLQYQYDTWKGDIIGIIDMAGKAGRQRVRAEMNAAIGPVNRRERHRQPRQRAMLYIKDATAEDHLRNKYIGQKRVGTIRRRDTRRQQ